METLSPFLKILFKLWHNWWLLFVLFLSFSAFVTPDLSVFGYSLTLLSLGIWIGNKSALKQSEIISSPASKKISCLSKSKKKV